MPQISLGGLARRHDDVETQHHVGPGVGPSEYSSTARQILKKRSSWEQSSALGTTANPATLARLCQLLGAPTEKREMIKGSLNRPTHSTPFSFYTTLQFPFQATSRKHKYD